MITVVLEGPDGAGKTTLARRLQGRYSAGYLHAGPPPPGATPASLLRAYAAMIVGPEPTIVDRWALGEMIYGPRFRERSLVDRRAWRTLTTLREIIAVPLVLCLPPKTAALETWRWRREVEFVRDSSDAEAVYDDYATLAGRGSAWSDWVYDYTQGPPADSALFAYLDRRAS